jgi:hypothetical protein
MKGNRGGQKPPLLLKVKLWRGFIIGGVVIINGNVIDNSLASL